MRKHAYLIMAHSNFQQLKFLLSLLDDKRNDIFLLIDKKVEVSDKLLGALKSACDKSNLIFVERTKVNWGGYSLIKAELLLLKAAVKTDHSYSYYHLISGSDLPLFSQDYIHEFFEQNPNKIFLSLVDNEIKNNNNIAECVRYKHYFNELYGKTRGSFTGKVVNKLDRGFVRVQKLLNKDVLKKFKIKDVGYASEWFSIDNETAQMLVEKEDYIEKVFKRSSLCDEVFLPTMVFKENMEHKLYTTNTLHDVPDELQGNLRYINWWEESLTGASPYVWKDGDEERLEYAASLGHLFARKFDLSDSPKLKELICKRCQKA